MRDFEIQAWWPWLLAPALCACLEPNPNAVDAGGTDGDNTSGPTETEGGPVCDPCELGFASVEFNANANGFSGSVPKPDYPHTVPIAVVREYLPGMSENLGYAITWTDAGDAWDFEVTLTGAANNSRVRGVAAVLGVADELGAPDVEEVQLTAADGCGSATITGLGGRTVVDAVERYEPGDDLVLNYTREASSTGGDLTIDYCITASDTPEAAIGYKVVAFDIPAEGVTALEVPEVTIDSGASQSDSYDQLGGGAEVLHLIGARELDESAATDLGYMIDCSASSPYDCDFSLNGFKAGARVVAGGTIVAIQ